MKREKPGQVRVHRGFLKAERVEALWPDGEVRVHEFGEPRASKMPPTRIQKE